MPLEVLVMLVAGGIGGIAIALHLLGKSAVPPLDEAGAAAGWARHFPDDPVRRLVLAGNGRAALIVSEAGRGLVWQLGADTVAHRLDGHQVRRGRSRLSVRFGEFGVPGITLDLEEAERALWLRELDRI